MHTVMIVLNFIIEIIRGRCEPTAYRPAVIAADHKQVLIDCSSSGASTDRERATESASILEQPLYEQSQTHTHNTWSALRS